MGPHPIGNLVFFETCPWLIPPQGGGAVMPPPRPLPGLPPSQPQPRAAAPAPYYPPTPAPVYTGGAAANVPVSGGGNMLLAKAGQGGVPQIVRNAAGLLTLQATKPVAAVGPVNRALADFGDALPAVSGTTMLALAVAALVGWKLFASGKGSKQQLLPPRQVVTNY